jgi:hypothetical protein
VRKSNDNGVDLLTGTLIATGVKAISDRCPDNAGRSGNAYYWSPEWGSFCRLTKFSMEAKILR